MLITEEMRDLRDRMLDEEAQNMIAVDWVTEDALARKSGQSTWEWTGNSELPCIGDEVLVFGGATGNVADYSIGIPSSYEDKKERAWERCVWVRLHSGGLVKAAGCECQLLTDVMREKLRNSKEDMKQKLVDAGKKIENIRKERRKNAVSGSHLLDEMLELASSMKLSIDENSSFYKITGIKKKCAVYVSLKGGRVDLSGFNVEHPSCIHISNEEAQQRHIGRVRGQLDFSRGDGHAMEAYEKALQKLKEK